MLGDSFFCACVLGLLLRLFWVFLGLSGSFWVFLVCCMVLSQEDSEGLRKVSEPRLPSFGSSSQRPLGDFFFKKIAFNEGGRFAVGDCRPLPPAGGDCTPAGA